MAKVKRLNISKTEGKKENLLSGAISGKVLYYSGFCLTDNLNFAFFYADTKIFVDNIPNKGLNRFKLSEGELNIEFDREKEVKPSKGLKEVSFIDIGYVDRAIFNTMKSIHPESVFHRVQTFFGQTVNSLIIVLHEEKGKPVGLLKAH